MRAHIAAGGSSQGKKQTGPEKIKKDNEKRFDDFEVKLGVLGNNAYRSKDPMKLLSGKRTGDKEDIATNVELIVHPTKIKGLNLLGTGDCLHPKWFDLINSNLSDGGSGILKSKSGFDFVLQGEISNIYSQDDLSVLYKLNSQ